MECKRILKASQNYQIALKTVRYYANIPLFCDFGSFRGDGIGLRIDYFYSIKSLIDGLLITSMAVCGGFGVVFLMYAFRNAFSLVLAPFGYFGILTSFLIGWIVFDEFPIDTLFPRSNF